MLNAMISMCTILFPHLEAVRHTEKGNGKNQIMEKFCEPEYTNFFKDKILYLCNRGGLFRMDKAMETAGILLNHKDCPDFFNENDIDLLVDVGIRELGCPNSEETRVQLLKILIICMRQTDYIKLFENRAEDVLVALDLQVEHEDVDYPYS